MSKMRGADGPDVLPTACVGSVCHLGRFRSHGCPSAGPGSCRLESKDDVASICASAYYDNRRGVLHGFTPENEAELDVTLHRGNLPPVPVKARPLRLPLNDAEVPPYVIDAGPITVDGPHRISMQQLRARLDGRKG